MDQPTTPDLSTPEAFATAAIRVLEANEEEAEIIRRAASTGPLARAAIYALVEGREQKIGVWGPRGRGKSTAIRRLASAMHAAGYGPLFQIEVDRDSSATGTNGLVRLPVPFRTALANLEEDDSGAAIRAAAKTDRKAASTAVRSATAKAAGLIAQGQGNGIVLESASSWWKAYYDLVQAEFPEGHEDAFGKERNRAYNESWTAVAPALKAVQTKAASWNNVGPLVSIIVVHARPAMVKPSSDKPAVFDGWGLDLGFTMEEKFTQTMDAVIGFGVDFKDGPRDPYPGKGGFYARYATKQHGICKARLDTDDEIALAEKHLGGGKKEGLASFLLQTYALRRRRGILSLREYLTT